MTQHTLQRQLGEHLFDDVGIIFSKQSCPEGDSDARCVELQNFG